MYYIEKGRNTSSDLIYYAYRIKEIKLDNPAVATELVDILRHRRYPKTIEHTAKWLQCLSSHPEVLLSIYQSNGIPVLVGLLCVPRGFISFYAIQILCNLIRNQTGSQEAICKAGGLQKMVGVLKTKIQKLLPIAVCCLTILAYKNQANKLVILSSGGTAELVSILRTCRSETLQVRAAAALKFLSTCSKNKHAIIKAGGVQALEKHVFLDHPDGKLALYLCTLRNLLEVSPSVENAIAFLKRLVHFLSSRGKIIIGVTAGILSHMTLNNAANKEIVCSENGVSLLVNIILKFKEVTILEPAMCTLSYLTCDHPGAERAQNDVRLHGGLQPNVTLGSLRSSWRLIKATSELIRNLTLSHHNLKYLQGLNTVDILKSHIPFLYKTILKYRGDVAHKGKEPIIIDGVKLEEIVEVALMALHNFSRNENPEFILKDPNIMSTLAEIWEKENAKIRCIVTSIFSEIISDEKILLAIYDKANFPPLSDSLRSDIEMLSSEQVEADSTRQYALLSTILDKFMQENNCYP